jgi:hypothetical protein
VKKKNSKMTNSLNNQMFSMPFSAVMIEIDSNITEATIKRKKKDCCKSSFLYLIIPVIKGINIEILDNNLMNIHYEFNELGLLQLLGHFIPYSANIPFSMSFSLASVPTMTIVDSLFAS